MVTKFKNYLAKTNLAKNTVTSYVWTVPVFPQPLWRSKQEEPFGIQGVFGRELQAADCEPEIARYQ